MVHSLQLNLKRILNTNKDVNIYYYYALILMIFFSDITQVLHSNRILYKPTRLYWINRTSQFAELVLGLIGVKTELSRKFSSHGSANGEPNMSSLVDQGLKVPMQCNQLSTLNWKRALTFQCKQTVLNGHVVNHKFVIQKGKLPHEKEYWMLAVYQKTRSTEQFWYRLTLCFIVCQSMQCILLLSLQNHKN